MSFLGLGNIYGGLKSQLGGLFESDADKQAGQMLDQGQRYQYVGANPYQGGWDSLIGQLQAQSAGKGPSLAGAQYNAAHQDALAAQLAMSRGRGAGSARQGLMGAGRLHQGMAQGAGQLRLQEQMAAQASLANALGAAGQSDFNRQYANQQAYTGILNNQMNQPTGFEQMLGIGSQLAGGYAMGSGGGGGRR